MKESIVVVKHGIYLQDVYGPFGTRALAEAALSELKAKEPDDYHWFEVWSLTTEGIDRFPGEKERDDTKV